MREYPHQNPQFAGALPAPGAGIYAGSRRFSRLIEDQKHVGGN
jgi:hypothetical protein